MSKPLSRTEMRSEERAKKARLDARSPLDELFSGDGGGAADWGNASPALVLDIIVAMSSTGGAVTFGLSRDGGAYMLERDRKSVV